MADIEPLSRPSPSPTPFTAIPYPYPFPRRIGLHFFFPKTVGGKGLALFNAWHCIIIIASVRPTPYPLPPIPPYPLNPLPPTPIPSMGTETPESLRVGRDRDPCLGMGDRDPSLTPVMATSSPLQSSPGASWPLPAASPAAPQACCSWR